MSYNGAYSGPPGSTVAVPAQAFLGTTEAAADLGTAGIGLRTASLDVPAPPLASIPLSSVATATLGLVDGGAPAVSALFTTGQSYTFVALGNVGEAPGTTPTFFRVIAAPGQSLRRTLKPLAIAAPGRIRRRIISTRRLASTGLET